MHGYGISAFGWRVAILADCESTRAVLDRYLFPWLPRGPVEVGEANAVFHVLPAEKGFQMRSGEQAVAHSATLETLIPLLQGLLDDGMVQQLSSVVAVHAGAVVIDGSAELVRRGCVYFSDEYALIDDPGPRASVSAGDDAAEWTGGGAPRSRLRMDAGFCSPEAVAQSATGSRVNCGNHPNRPC